MIVAPSVRASAVILLWTTDKEAVNEETLAGGPITTKLTRAPGNNKAVDAPIDDRT